MATRNVAQPLIDIGIPEKERAQIALRNVRYWPCVKLNTSRSSGGTSNATTTASAVSGSTSRTRSE